MSGTDRFLLHRALSSPSRARLLALLRAEGPESIASLAERAGLHPNTVRAHLAVLEEVGLVDSHPQPRQGPGRPRLVYEALDRREIPETVAERDPGDGYRFLAQMLAGHVAVTAENPTGEATALGTAWGRHLTEVPPPSRPVGHAEALSELVSMLDGLGFDPAVEAHGTGDRLLLRRCPFLEVAEQHQDVVCSIHLGLMRGAMAALGDPIEVVDLVPFAGPEGCVSHLT